MVDVYGNLNLKQNQPQFMVLHKGTSFPVSPVPVAGQLFYKTDETKVYYYDGTDWKAVGSGSGSGGIGRFTEAFTSQTNISITHNLGDLNPLVQVYDTNNEQITPDVIDITSGNVVNLQFNTATSGFVTIHGGQGADIGTTAYYSQAFTSQTTVNVAHGLNQKYVVVQAFDSTDALVEPQSVTVTDLDNLVVTFGTATTGRIIVAGGATLVTVLGVKRYQESFTSQTSFTVTHNLNTTTPQVSVYDNSGVLIFPDITVIDVNSVQIDIATTTSGKVEVQGGVQSTSPGAGTADFLPNANNTWDFGSGTFKWKDGYFQGNLYGNGSNLTGIQGGYREIYVVKTGGTVGVDCSHTTITSALISAATGNKDIFIKNGTYTEALTIGTDNITLIGESKEGVIITQSSGTTGVINVYSTTQNLLNITIKNLTVKATGSTDLSCIKVQTYGSLNLSIDKIRIENCNILNQSTGLDAVRNAAIILSCGAATAHTNVLSNVWIKDCYFNNNAEKKSSISLFTDTSGSSFSTLKNVFIDKNVFDVGTADADPTATGWYSTRSNVIQLRLDKDYAGTQYEKNIQILGNIINNTGTGTNNCAIVISEELYSETGILTAQEINISNNIMNSSGSTNNYGISLVRNTTSGVIDGVTMIGNTITASAAKHIVQTNTPTNIVDVGNNKI